MDPSEELPRTVDLDGPDVKFEELVRGVDRAGDQVGLRLDGQVRGVLVPLRWYQRVTTLEQQIITNSDALVEARRRLSTGLLGERLVAASADRDELDDVDDALRETLGDDLADELRPSAAWAALRGLALIHGPGAAAAWLAEQGPTPLELIRVGWHREALQGMDRRVAELNRAQVKAYPVRAILSQVAYELGDECVRGLSGLDDIEGSLRDGAPPLPQDVEDRLRAARGAIRILALGDHRGPDPLPWMRTPHPRLDTTPTEAIRTGRFDEVLDAAARAVRYVLDEGPAGE